MTPRTEEERSRAYDLLMQKIAETRCLIEKLLGGSVVSESEIVLNRKPVSLRTILTEAEKQLRSTCDASRLKVMLTLPPEPIYLVADAARIEKVFGDLFGNACTRSGESCQVTVTAERVPEVEPAQILVRVRDDGAAIDTQLLPRVFEKPASRTAGQEADRTNADLTFVQRIVKMHGGGIEVANAAPGRGVEFTVHLPILEVVSLAPAEKQPATVSGEVRRRILIVDDNLDSVQGMATLQKRRGHDVRTAATGPEALEVAAEFHPDVVLLDIGLPGMDGFEVAKKLRASPEFQRAFLIAMTGFATPEDRRHAKEVGFDEHLIKPVDLNRLRAWLADEARFSR